MVPLWRIDKACLIGLCAGINGSGVGTNSGGGCVQLGGVLTFARAVRRTHVPASVTRTHHESWAHGWPCTAVRTANTATMLSYVCMGGGPSSNTKRVPWLQ
eukprot:XP_001701232.1 predicted protein [Chlamydomonas reinhardtii]